MADNEWRTLCESLVSECGHKGETIADAKNSSELEYLTHTNNPNYSGTHSFANPTNFGSNTPIYPTYSELDLPTSHTYSDSESPTYGIKLQGEEESSDSVMEDIETTENTELHARDLTNSKSNDYELHQISNGENRLIDNLNGHGEMSCSANIIDTGLKIESAIREILNAEKNDADCEMVLFNREFVNTYYQNVTRIILLMIRKHRSALEEMGIDHLTLLEQENEIIKKSMFNIYKKICRLIEKDIDSNGFPLVFNQIVPLVIREMCLPYWNKPSVKKLVEDLDEIFKNHKLNTLVEMAKINKDVTDTTISNTIKILHEHFKKLIIDDNENNRKLAELYEKNLERLLKIFGKDWSENKAPLSLFHHILGIFLGGNPIFVDKMIFKQECSKYVKEEQKEKENTFPLFLMSLRSKRKKISDDDDIADISEESAEEEESLLEKGLNHIKGIISVFHNNKKPDL